MNVSIPYGGGCACRAIRYACASLPLFIFQCHCRDCQRATGGPFAVNVWFKLPDLTFTAEPAHHAVESDAGLAVHHHFCRDCGSPLGMQRQGAPVRGVRAASLDDPSWLLPMANVWTCNVYPWETLCPDLGSFETQPREDEWPAVFAEQARIFERALNAGSHEG